MLIPQPITLTGTTVRLEPMTWGHLAVLTDLGSDEDLWRWTTTAGSSPELMRAYVEEALTLQARGTALPFVTIDLASGRLVGSTRFGNIDVPNARLEIGWTWVARPWRRTRVNSDAKYLMLRHAFETLGAMRVELKTDRLNERSRAAILRLGATEEGTFRKHVVTHSGRIRDSVWFSIVDDEWPTVKAGMEQRLGQP